MTTAVSTVLHKIDWQFILDHFTEESLWKKKWTVFEYGDVKVVLRLKTIDIDRNRVELATEVTLEGRRIYTYDFNNLNIPINKDHFNKQVFDRSLYNAIKRKISLCELDIVGNMPEYSKAREMDEMVEEQWRDDANEFLDDNDVSNDAIREAYIDAHVGNMEEDYVKYSKKLIDDLRYTLLTPCYLMNAHLNATQDDYEEFVQYVDTDKDAILEQVKEDAENFDIESIAEKSQEELPEL